MIYCISICNIYVKLRMIKIKKSGNVKNKIAHILFLILALLALEVGEIGVGVLSSSSLILIWLRSSAI